MVGFETAINQMVEIFFTSTFAGQNWLMYLTVIIASCMIITRKWQDWGTLALPVMIGWRYFGMPVPFVFIMIGILIFVVDIMSLRLLSGAFSGLEEYASKIITRTGRKKLTLRKMDMKAEIERLNEKLEAGGSRKFEDVYRERIRRRDAKRDLDIWEEKVRRKKNLQTPKGDYNYDG